MDHARLLHLSMPHLATAITHIITLATLLLIILHPPFDN